MDWRRSYALKTDPEDPRRERATARSKTPFAAAKAAYMRSAEFYSKRQAALQRAEHCCQVCNSSQRLGVHHRTYRRLFVEHDADLTVLCADCHALFTRYDRLRRHA